MERSIDPFSLHEWHGDTDKLFSIDYMPSKENKALREMERSLAAFGSVDIHAVTVRQDSYVKTLFVWFTPCPS
jgi:hypothetical protein